ncbi:MAG: hypothetical protein ABSC57_05670, partial [Syntrophales bacterium]
VYYVQSGETVYSTQRNKGDMPMPKVTVYYFTDYNIVTDQIIRSKRMATFVWVKSLNYMPLMETAKEVDTSELDDDGLYPKKETI